MKVLSATLATTMMLTLSACGPEDALDPQGGSEGEARELRCGYGSPQRIFVSNSSELLLALETVRPGDEVVLANGTYSSSDGFILERSGTAEQPITFRAARPLGAELRSTFDIHADYVVLAGLDVSGVSVELDGTGSRVTRSRFRDTEGTALVISGGVRPRVDHCEFVAIRGRGITVKPGAGKVQNPLIDRNHFHHFVGPAGGDAFEAVLLGATEADSDVPLRATLQYNLFEGLGVDAETVAVRSSGNTVRFNTLVRARNLANLHGEDNLYLGNWAEESEGFLLHDQRNQLQANKCVGCTFGFRIMAGGSEPQAPTTALAPYARDTLLTGNDGPVIIGQGHGAPGLGELPRGTNIDRGHVGPIKVIDDADYFRFSYTGPALATPLKLGEAQVGPRSGTCHD